jgi:hypothetical protein
VLSHPNNRGHNYVVRPAAPINLMRRTLNDDSRREVALTTLRYTNRFYQLREDVTIHAVVIVPGIDYMHIEAPLGKPAQLDVDFNEHMTAINAMSETVRRILRPFVKGSTNRTETWFVLFSKLIIPAGEYKTTMVLARRVAKEFWTIFNIPRYQYRMKVERVGGGGRLRFTAESKLETPAKGSRHNQHHPDPTAL